ncbi:MAG: hypothetical protein ACJAYG_001371 [Oceanicoccus sp.]|jgi:hypothetical protein
MSQNMPSFDSLLELAQHSPEEFEQLRNKLANDIIEAAPQSQRIRLRGLQFIIDSNRRLSKNPLGACIRISQMMHNSFEDMRQALNGSIQRPTKTRHNAGVITFHRNSEN